MQDYRNQVEHSGIKIWFNHLKDVQNLMKKYPSIRFLHNPEFYCSHSYFVISFGGDVKECNEFSNEIYQAGWEWKKPTIKKKGFFKRLFGKVFQELI